MSDGGVVLLKVLAFEGLTKLPIGGSNMPCSGESAIAGSNPEGERLANHHGVGGPFLTPQTRQGGPFQLTVALDLDSRYVPSSSHVPHHYFVEVWVSGDCEANSSLLLAWNPTVSDGNDAGLIVGKVGENRLGYVEMLEGGIAPSAIVVGSVVVGWTVVGAGYHEGGLPRLAIRIVHAFEFKASAAFLPVVKQRHA